MRDAATSVPHSINGSKVLDLMPGANDIRFLAPGVYFIQTGSGIERKVVIAR